jgi:hypothetical protein
MPQAKQRARKPSTGSKTGGEAAAEISAEPDEPVAPELPDERERRFRTPGFSRMRITWSGEDGQMLDTVKRTIDMRIMENFQDAYSIMFEIYNLVRDPVIGPGGAPEFDEYGFPVWARTSSGGFIEDWTRLGAREKERFLFEITTRIFAWEQSAADAWGEAMFAKAAWEEAFAIKYDAPMNGTIEDRNAVGKIGSREERYFAIFVSYYSRRADAIVRSMALLAQRIKDSMAG